MAVGATGFRFLRPRRRMWSERNGPSPRLSLWIIGWAVAGPYFHYSDTWQLVVNTATTVVTFLIVFLIQNTQNRDAKAIHLKLDEIIRSIHPAHNEMIDIEKLSDEELERLSAQYEQIRKECEARESERKGA